MTDTVPLNKLVLSPRNVRKTNGEEDIAGLAESIKSKGLLQNLVVSPSADGKGIYEVDAGGRRWRALQLLADRKDLPKNWPVPVHVIACDAAIEASLAENLQKIAMNPADEVEAFATIVEGYQANGMTSPTERIANCARRFGVTERYVGQRLALAALAPDILAALRENRITIAAASAYASHPDHAEQMKVFTAHEKRTGSYGKHDTREIRDALKGRVYQVDHKLVRFIGLDAYRDAGGEIATDLFFEEGEREILLNPVLVDKLATAKGELEAQKLAQADGWLDAALKSVTSTFWSTPSAPKGYVARYCTPSEIGAEKRAESMAIYTINDQAELELDTHYAFFKAAEPAAAEPTISAEERKARYEASRRQDEIQLRAARLAIPAVAGTPFEGKAFWPRETRWVEPFEVDNEGNAIVAMLVKIPSAELEAQLGEAERRYELQQRELAEEAEALEAEDGDGEFDDEDDDHLEPVADPVAAREPEVA